METSNNYFDSVDIKSDGIADSEYTSFKDYLNKELDFYNSKNLGERTNSEIKTKIVDFLENYDGTALEIKDKYIELKQGILSETGIELNKDREVAQLQHAVYDYCGIDKITYNNCRIDQFKKGFIDNIIIGNYELVELVKDNGISFLIDALLESLSWDMIGEVFDSLGESIYSLLTGNSYEKGISFCDVGFSGFGLALKLGKESIKIGLKKGLEKGAEKIKSSEVEEPDLSAKKSLKNDTYSSEEIRGNFSIVDDVQRKQEAVKIMENKYPDSFEGFSEEQLDGIIDAHNIGSDVFEQYMRNNGIASIDDLSDTQIKEIFNSKEGRIALRQKMKKLREVGISTEDADSLIRAGITGGGDLSGKIASKETLDGISNQASNVRDILLDADKFKGLLSRLQLEKASADDLTLLPQDITLIDDVLELVNKGMLTDIPGLNTKVVEVLKKAKEGNNLIFDDIRHLKNLKKNLNKPGTPLVEVADGNYSNLPNFQTRDGLYSSLDNTFDDVDLNKLNGDTPLSETDLLDVQSITSELLTLNFVDLFADGLDFSNIKPLKYFLKYGGFSDKEVTKRVQFIVDNMQPGGVINQTDIAFIQDMSQFMHMDPRLISIKKGDFETVGLVSEAQFKLKDIQITSDLRSNYGSIDDIPNLKQGLSDVLSDSGDKLDNLFSSSGKVNLDRLLHIKDDTWDVAGDADDLSKLLRQNTQRSQILQNMGFSLSEIDRLGEMSLI